MNLILNFAFLLLLTPFAHAAGGDVSNGGGPTEAAMVNQWIQFSKTILLFQDLTSLSPEEKNILEKMIDNRINNEAAQLIFKDPANFDFGKNGQLQAFKTKPIAGAPIFINTSLLYDEVAKRPLSFNQSYMLIVKALAYQTSKTLTTSSSENSLFIKIEQWLSKVVVEHNLFHKNQANVSVKLFNDVKNKRTDIFVGDANDFIDVTASIFTEAPCPDGVASTLSIYDLYIGEAQANISKVQFPVHAKVKYQCFRNGESLSVQGELLFFLQYRTLILPLEFLSKTPISGIQFYSLELL